MRKWQKLSCYSKNGYNRSEFLLWVCQNPQNKEGKYNFGFFCFSTNQETSCEEVAEVPATFHEVAGTSAISPWQSSSLTDPSPGIWQHLVVFHEEENRALCQDLSFKRHNHCICFFDFKHGSRPVFVI